MLKQWYPNLPLQEFRGKGSSGASSKTTVFKFGTQRENVTNYVNLKYLMEHGEVTFDDIHEVVQSWVPDASFDTFTYVERNCKLGNPNWKTILCKFDRLTVPYKKLKALTESGGYPMEDVKELIDAIKESLEDLPIEIASRFKPSCMVLTTTPDIHGDGAAIQALWRRPMVFMEDRIKEWKVKDYEYKSRGGPRT